MGAGNLKNIAPLDQQQIFCASLDFGILTRHHMETWHKEWYICEMRYLNSIHQEKPLPTKLKKLTLQVPDDLLTQAMQATREGITPTIRRGLELVVADGAYRNLRALKGKVKLQLDLESLRQDR